MLSYFAAEILDDEVKLGVIFGLYVVAMFFGLSFGHLFYLKLQYRDGIWIAYLIETISVLFYIFLDVNSSYGLILTMFIFGGFTTSVSDSIIQMIQIDASGTNPSSTFLYSWFQSWLNAGATIGGTAFPQAKENLSWNMFWIWNIIICGIFTILSASAFYLIPFLKTEPILISKPTLEFKQCCSRQVQGEPLNGDE